ncbi:mitochondrial import inner membrane translocase subunit Tim9 isoform X1 [Sinocyclocheilus grahami]|uniref:mitochondrial import inner membrane translocase subunit Tim9 isoform X1 n=1 Tax=Sinocyclocheilus grahami TaxID=75366 RepID=UPI0007ACC81F|nr:PREDICTED: mitochondrial import inner membrane translocase subunit Tim9 isoform X1 [Sinocyclocheilus grahami]
MALICYDSVESADVKQRISVLFSHVLHILSSDSKASHCTVTMAAQVTESDQIKQFKEFLGTYNKLTENCFMDCVKDFTTREVKPEETSCSESCLQKYLKMTQRISMRFQEYHIQQNEALAAKAGLLGQPR